MVLTKLHKVLIHRFMPIILSTNEQKVIIDSMPEPMDDFDRVYFNHLCNTRNNNTLVTIILNAISLVLIPFFLIIYALNFFRMKSSEPVVIYDAIIISSTNRYGKVYSYNGIIPKDIYDNYKNVKILNVGTFPKFFDGVLTRKAFKIWLLFLKKHVFSGFLNFRALFSIMSYNRLILKYKPKAIVISRAELNNMSSLISLFCENNDICYINLMHGELFVSIQTAFVRFSKFYIWDEHYKKIFFWGRSPQNQFIVFTPDIYVNKLTAARNPVYYITYIFTGNEITGIDINAEAVKRILLFFTDNGKKCKIRPHPRWSNIEQLYQLFSNTGIEIENPKSVGVKESVLLSEKVAGTFSTVLTEAYHFGVTVVIDDVTNPELMEELKQKMYIMLEKPHELLSDICLKYNYTER